MRATTGEPPRFEDRFAPLAALAYKVAYRLTGDRAESEDMAQEALARAYLRWRKVAPYDEAWVARVATNLAIGRWRPGRGPGRRRHRPVRRGARPARPDRGRAGAAGVAAPPAGGGRPSLPGHLPEADVAAHLGCSVGAVEQHTHRGLAALRRAAARPAHDEERTDVRASR